MKYPEFICPEPEPCLTMRQYNGRKMPVWECKVDVAKIVGWVENPRIEVERKRFHADNGTREMSQEEVYDIMKRTEDFKLSVLRDDILKNGLREPLTLTWGGKLLDGNRRFFALKYALEKISPADPNRQDLERVPAYVLQEKASEEEQHDVLVEENFSASLKLEWPDYVKARMIVEANRNGLDEKQIAQKFGWSKTKVRDAIKIDEIVQGFMSFATAAPDPEDELGGGLGLTEAEAEGICAKNYQFFNEAKKSFHSQLKTDPEFAANFFRWIKEGKFASFPEVRIAYKAWENPEAKAELMKPEPTAAKAAKAVIDYTARVAHTSDEIEGRIANFTAYINAISVEQLRKVSSETIDSFNKMTTLFAKLLKQTQS